MNAFPINGLHPDGCKNADGERLHTRLDITAAPLCQKEAGDEKLYLDYAWVDESAHERGYELVARAKRSDAGKFDDVRCKRDQLVGVEFEVTVRDPKKKPDKYRIGDVAKVYAQVISDETSCHQGQALCSTFKNVTEVPRVAYLVTPVGGSQSVCMTPPPEEIDVTAPAVIVHVPHGKQDSISHVAKKVEDLKVVQSEDLPLYATVVPEAVYNFGAALIQDSYLINKITSSDAFHSSHHWFNIACVKDALAQTELLPLGHKPCQAQVESNALSPRTPSPEKQLDSNDKQPPPEEEIAKQVAHDRLPALHMFTAKYYDGRSATTRGTPIRWCWGPGGKELGATEAVWKEEGAACVSHSRLWRKDKIVYVPAQVRELFIPPVTIQGEHSFLKRICEEPPGSTGAGYIVQYDCTVSEGQLASYVIDHSAEDNNMILAF